MVNPTSSDAVLETDKATLFSNTTTTTTTPIKVEEMDVEGTDQCDSKLVDAQEEEVKVKKEHGVGYGGEPMKEEPGAHDAKPALPKLVLRLRQPTAPVKSDQDASGQ